MNNNNNNTTTTSISEENDEFGGLDRSPEAVLSRVDVQIRSPSRKKRTRLLKELQQLEGKRMVDPFLDCPRLDSWALFRFLLSTPIFIILSFSSKGPFIESHLQDIAQILASTAYIYEDRVSCAAAEEAIAVLSKKSPAFATQFIRTIVEV